ncbi:MAG: ABC transporter permease [Pseudomonadota bacterium]
MQQLLFLEMVLKLSAGCVLVLLPLTASRVLGLPKPERGVWHRLLGSVLIGLAGAIYLEGRLPGSSGLGLAGLVVINLSAVAVVFSSLVLNLGASTGRGRSILALTAVLLLVLSILEIAHVPMN